MNIELCRQCHLSRVKFICSRLTQSETQLFLLKFHINPRTFCIDTIDTTFFHVSVIDIESDILSISNQICIRYRDIDIDNIYIWFRCAIAKHCVSFHIQVEELSMLEQLVLDTIRSIIVPSQALDCPVESTLLQVLGYSNARYLRRMIVIKRTTVWW